MSSRTTTITYDGIRQVNACYHSVIEEVTKSLQGIFEDEKEEEKKRLKSHLENRRKTLQAKLEKDAKESKKKKTSAAAKNGAGEDEPQLLRERAELKRVEALLKKPASKIFEPDAVIADLLHVWLQNLRSKIPGGKSSKTVDGSKVVGAPATDEPSSMQSQVASIPSKTVAKRHGVDQTDGANSSDGEDNDDDAADVEESDDGIEAFSPPLCEKDDVSDDLDNAFDCEDVIYCRSGEVAREKGTRWRIRLKEGIANFNGKDILFKECSSDLLDF